MQHLSIDSFSALLFDLDGTLIDTMPLHNQAWIETLQEFNCPMTDEILQEYAGVPTLKTVSLLNHRFQWNLDPALVTEKKEERARELAGSQSVRLIEPTLAIVKKYHGKKPMALVTGGARILVQPNLQKFDLEKYFPFTVCMDDTTRGKPHPDPFLLAAKKVNTAPENCLVFEDGAAGIAGAQACGMSVVQVLKDFKLAPLYTIK